MTIAQQRAEGVLIAVEPLYAAAFFGLLAVEIFSTGMRINEAMQIRIARDCYVELDVPAPPEATDQRPTRKWFFRVIPKGERTSRPRDYHVDEETRKVIARVVWFLCREHYGRLGDEGLPLVRFAQGNARAHRFTGLAPYLFQYQGRALEDATITACLRFLLHGLVFTTADGRPVTLSSHHFRHLVGTYLLQVEEVPLGPGCDHPETHRSACDELCSGQPTRPLPSPPYALLAEVESRGVRRSDGERHASERVGFSDPLDIFVCVAAMGSAATPFPTSATHLQLR